MDRIINGANEYFHWNATSFDEAYRYPDKIFNIIGNRIVTIMLLSHRYVVFCISKGIKIGKRERTKSLVSIYRWLGLLSPILYFIFALNCFDQCTDMQCYLQITFGIAAVLNVSSEIFLVQNLSMNWFSKIQYPSCLVFCKNNDGLCECMWIDKTSPVLNRSE